MNLHRECDQCGFSVSLPSRGRFCEINFGGFHWRSFFCNECRKSLNTAAERATNTVRDVDEHQQ